MASWHSPIVRIAVPVSASHNVIEPFARQDKNLRPSGATAIAVIGHRRDSIARSWFSDSKFQTFRVPSWEDEIARAPSEVTTTSLTPSVWPVRVCNNFPVCISQTVNVESQELDTTFV